MNTVPTAVHVEHYGRIVERKAVLRNLIGAAGQIAAVGYEEPTTPRSRSTGPSRSCSRSASAATDGGFEPLSTLLARLFDRLDYIHEHRGQIVGVPTGFRELDALPGGLQPSDLIILAARPRVGKTSLALNIAHHAALREAKNVGVFRLEMREEQLVQRLISSESGINPRPLQTGFVDETEWSEDRRSHERDARGADVDRRLAGLSVMELRTKARRLEAEQRGLDLSSSTTCS